MSKEKAPDTVELTIPKSAEERTRPKVAIGDIVHYFDETRAQTYGPMRSGPYAALVVFAGPLGVELEVFGRNGGRFQASDVPHKSALGDHPGRKRWWVHK